VAIIAVNNRDATSTRISPFFATYGYHVDLIKLIDPKEELRTIGRSLITLGEAFMLRLKEATELAQAVIASAQER